VKYIDWNFDGLNFVNNEDKYDDLKKLRLENGGIAKSYFNN
jgi:hypothetical protein